METRLTPHRILYLTNPASANGQQSVEPVGEVFRRAGIDWNHQILSLDTPVQTLLDRYPDTEALVVGGGDGTLNCVAQAVLDTDMPLGIIPLGTANDFARSLGIPMNPEQAAEVICQGRLSRVYPAEINERLCFNAANIGLGERVRRHNSNVLKKVWGFMSYSVALYSAYRSQAPFEAVIHGRKEEQRLDCLQIGIGAGRFYGGGAQVAHDADPRLKTMVLYALKPKGFWSLFRSGPALRRGELERVEAAIRMDDTCFDITTRPVQGVTVDGEAAGHTPVRCRVHSQGMPVFVPEPSH